MWLSYLYGYLRYLIFYHAPVYLPKIGYKKDTQIEEGSCYETIEKKNILHFSDGTPIILYNNKKDQERL